jgi:hypothetical protein
LGNATTVNGPVGKTKLPSDTRIWRNLFFREAITFTTVGYGDIIPSTVQAKILAMFTALFGATHGVTFVAIILQALTRPPSKGEE